MLNVLLLSLSFVLTSLPAFDLTSYVFTSFVSKDVKDVKDFKSLKTLPRASVRIINYSSSFDGSYGVGSGTLISDTTILTAAHVIDSPGQLVVVLEGGIAFPATVFHISNIYDLGVIKVPDVVTVTPKEYGVANTGDIIYLTGHPGIMAKETEKSVVIDQLVFLGSDLIARHYLIFPCGKVRQGYSGAGVVNSQGRIVGVMVSKNAALNMCYAVASEDIRDYFKRGNDE